MPVINGTFYYPNGAVARRLVADTYTPISTDININGTLHDKDGVMYMTANLVPGANTIHIGGILHTRNGVRGTAIIGGATFIRGRLYTATGNAVAVQASPNGSGNGPGATLNGALCIADVGVSEPSDPTNPMYQAWVRTFEITAGDNASLYGYVNATFGTITPDPPEVYNGQDIIWFVTRPSNDRFVIRIQTSADTDATFKTIEISGTFTGGADVITLQRENRVTYTTEGGGTNEWEFTITSDQHMVNGNVYDVAIVGTP